MSPLVGSTNTSAALSLDHVTVLRISAAPRALMITTGGVTVSLTLAIEMVRLANVMPVTSFVVVTRRDAETVVPVAVATIVVVPWPTAFT